MRHSPHVATFADAEAWLAGGRNKRDRPLQNNTRLIRLHEDRIAVRLHATNVVVLHRDGTFTINTGGWNTVTTKDRLRSYSPASVYSVRGQLFVSHKSDAVSPPRVQNCRSCKGMGHTWQRCEGPGWCYAYGTCQHGRTERHLRDTCWHDKTGWHTWRQDCYRCSGTGQRDYGSRPIAYRWDGDWLRVDDTGKVIGPEWLDDAELRGWPSTQRTVNRRSWYSAEPATPTQLVERTRPTPAGTYRNTEPTQADIVAEIEAIDAYEREHGHGCLAELNVPYGSQLGDNIEDPCGYRFC